MLTRVIAGRRRLVPLALAFVGALGGFFGGPGAGTASAQPAAPSATADSSAPSKLDEDAIIKKIKDSFVCQSGSTISEAEAEGSKCENGDYMIGVVKRIIEGTVTDSDIITTARFFPQGKSLITKLDSPACNKDGKLQLDFFVMSYCPYSVRFMDTTLTAMINDLGDSLEWTPYFIIERDGGKLVSMHGKKEVDEDLRMVCIREKFGGKKWLGYANCFSQQIFGKQQTGGAKKWKDCALQVDINPDDIDKCVQNEADKLIEKDIKLSNDFHAYASPTAVYNCSNKIVGAIPYKKTKAQVCKLIPGDKPAACKAPKK